MRSFILAGVVALSMGFGATGAVADVAAPAGVEFAGGATPIKLSVEELAQLPQVEETVSFKTSKGVTTARYKGPLLWDVVKSTKALDGLEHNKELVKILIVTAIDGYQIAFSIGELEPDFGNARILLVIETDGKPLARGFQIVAQGDKRGARAVHDIVSIELR